MMKMLKKTTALLFIFFSPFAFAFSQADLVAQLQKPENVQGQFEQQRFLKSLPKPIKSHGDFVLWQKHGLLWQMKTPFESQIRVKADGIMQWNGESWIANNKIGQSDQIKLFLGLLSGDISALESQFDLALSGNEKAWQLTLTPNSLLMKQIFTQIKLNGSTLVESIELFETQGDRTLILLQNAKQNQPLADFAKQALSN